MRSKNKSAHMSEILLYRSSSSTRLTALNLGGSGQRDNVLGE